MILTICNTAFASNFTYHCNLNTQFMNQSELRWNWVKGHSSDKFNNEVDSLARNAAS